MLTLTEPRSACCGAHTKVRRTPRKGVYYVCKACHYECSRVTRILQATVTPAYGRRPVTEAEVLDWFYRGFDYRVYPDGPYTSVRDCISGTKITFLHGKRLQRSFEHVVDLTRKR